MSEYKLEIKQTVSYPRCRIYRKFIKGLIEDRNISLGGSSDFFITLCCALLDMWINTIYNDERVDGSKVGPVVYYRNCSGNPLISYDTLAKR